MATARTDSIDWPKLKKFLLTCPVCLESFDDQDKKAKHLPECQHSVCEQCIKNILQQQPDETGEFPCPECRTATTLPEGGVSGFKTSLHIERLRNYVPTGRLPQTSHACQACCDSAPAEGWCHSGCGYLCRVCFKAHRQKMRYVQDHDFESLTPELEAQLQKLETQRICGVHKQEFTQVCETCNDEFICDLCMTTTHLKTDGHRYCNLTTVAEKDKVALDGLVDSALSKQKEIMEMLKAINRDKNRWTKKAEQAKKDSKTFYDQCHTELEEYHKLVTWSIESAHKRVQSQMQKRKENAQLCLMEMGTCYEYVTRLCDVGSSLDIVRARKEVGPKMQEIAETDFDASLHQSENILQFLSQESNSLVSDHLTTLGQVVDMVVQTVPTDSLLLMGSKCRVQFSISNSVENLRVEDTECFCIEVQDPNQQKVKCDIVREQESAHAVGLSVFFTPHHSGQHSVNFVHSNYVDKIFYKYTLDVAGYYIQVVNSTLKEVKAKLVFSDTNVFPMTNQIRVILMGPMQGTADNKVLGRVEYDTTTKEYAIVAKPNLTGDHILKIHIGDMETQKVFWVTEGKLHAEASLCICNRACCVKLRGSVRFDSVDIRVVDPTGQQIAWEKAEDVFQDESKNRIKFTPSIRGSYHLIVRDKKTQALHCHIAITCCLLNVVKTTKTAIVGGVCHVILNAENAHGEQIDLPKDIIALAMSTPSTEGALCRVKYESAKDTILPVKASIDPGDKKTLRIQFVPQSEGKHTILMLTKVWGPSHDAILDVHAQKSEDFGPNYRDPDGFKHPSDIAIGHDGLIHVADTRINGCIKSLDKHGKCVRKVPLSLKGNSLCVCDSEGFLHVMYPIHRKLYKISPHGVMTVCSIPDNIKHPVDIAINQEGHLLILDKSGIFELKHQNNQFTQVHRLKKKWENCAQICVDSQGLMYVSKAKCGVTILDDFFGKSKGHYPIEKDLTVGGIALSSDDQHLLVSTQDKQHKYDFLYVFDTKTHKQEISRTGRVGRGEISPYSDRMVILHDGFLLRLEGECNRIRQYGYLYGNVPWS